MPKEYLLTYVVRNPICGRAARIYIHTVGGILYVMLFVEGMDIGVVFVERHKSRMKIVYASTISITIRITLTQRTS